MRQKLLNADGQTERWTNKMKLTVACHYFADNLKNSLKISGRDGKYSFYRQHWCQVTTHIQTVHWQTQLLCVLRDTNSIFTLKVSHF